MTSQIRQFKEDDDDDVAQNHLLFYPTIPTYNLNYQQSFSLTQKPQKILKNPYTNVTSSSSSSSSCCSIVSSIGVIV